MSFTQKPQNFPARITDKILAQQIAAALRQEHAHISAMLKHIEAVTGIPAKTASKWVDGQYTPKSRHLLILAACYPEVLRIICETMGMESIWQHVLQAGVVDAMRAQLDARWNRWQKRIPIGDKFVLIRVRVDARFATQLNQRQLWFLGELQQGNQMQPADIVHTWHVHAKTAQRDIKGLLIAKLIVITKIGRGYNYAILP